MLCYRPAIGLLQLCPGSQQWGMRAALGTSSKDCPGFTHIPLTRFQQCPLHQQWGMPTVQQSHELGFCKPHDWQ